MSLSLGFTVNTIVSNAKKTGLWSLRPSTAERYVVGVGGGSVCSKDFVASGLLLKVLCVAF